MNNKTTPFTHLAPDFYFSIVFLNDIGRNRQPESGPSGITLGGEKGVHDTVQIIIRHPDSLVLHRYKNVTACPIVSRGHINTLFCIGEGVAGILNQVDHDLFEFLIAPLDRRQVLTIFHRETLRGFLD